MTTRRSWSAAEKLQIVMELLNPKAEVKFSPGARRSRRAELRGHIALHKTPTLYFPEPEAGTDTTGGARP